MTKLNPKTPSESSVLMTELVLPVHTNSHGSIFGGTVMSWIDIAAAIASGKHSRKSVVTASVDALHFIAPIKLGNVVTIRAEVNRAFKTSMEVGVRVDSEDWRDGKSCHNVSAYVTFVALDENDKPTAVPPISPQTDEEKRRFEEAQKRKESRLALKKDLNR